MLSVSPSVSELLCSSCSGWGLGEGGRKKGGKKGYMVQKREVLLLSSRTLQSDHCALALHWRGQVGSWSVLVRPVLLITEQFCYMCAPYVNTLRTGDADLRFYITTVQDGWRKSAFLTRACFTCTIYLIMQYIEPVSEWYFWRMFIETWPHSELNFRHRASSI